MQGIFYAQSQKIFLTEGILARWLSECYCRTADHGHDVMITQYLFLFLSRTVFQYTSTATDFKICHCYCTKQIDDSFIRFVLLSPIEMTLKCSKLFDETTRLRLVVPLEFWTFWHHFNDGRWQYDLLKPAGNMTQIARACDNLTSLS